MSGDTAPGRGNRHPAVMFEIIARDQEALKKFYTAVFGWDYREGSAGFDYIEFPATSRPLLGGIGQAMKNTPGFEPGRSFYLEVESLEKAIERARASGGSIHMKPAEADGYHFAMIKDPEGNVIGLVEPFGA